MLGGWSLNALMVYLIYVTARTITKIWDPYEVLGVSRVCVVKLRHAANERFSNKSIVSGREADQEALP
jgi:preprotein translocase subunit Sec63